MAVPLERMVKRVTSFAVAAVFAALVVVGGSVCDAKAGEMECCCAPRSAPVASAETDFSCRTLCGAREDDAPATPPHLSPATPDLAAPQVAPRVETADDTTASAIPVALKSVAASVTRHRPPDCYLENATFLI